jgi:predicted ABC-type transport system involved in lysophospholipase L1 biosynthesis ATPase subunit
MDRPGHPGGPAAGSGEAAVEAEGVTKVFGAGDDAVVALDEVSITIRQNEFFTLLGPSGCGKTTLLRLIAGFEHPTAGRILLDGEDIGALPPFKRPVNTVFQSYALFPHMTVAGNIAFGLEMLGRPKREVAETVVAMLRLVRMEALASRRTSQLSGGQQQRVALVRALATGSDIGGSIRIPASTCGLAGYKPPYGRNPDDPPFNLDFYCHTGPLARSVADAAILQNVMCGPHPRDISTLRPKLRLPASYKDIKGWRIAFSMDLGFYEVDGEVAANTRRALDVFRDLGATVAEVDLGWTAKAFQAGLDYLDHIFGASLSTLLDEHGGEMTTYARALAERGRKSSAVDFLRTLEVANSMYETLGPILETHHLLVCPTTALSAVAADFDHERDTVAINGVTVNSMLGWVMTSPFNTMSRCPVLTLPSGRAGNGVPTGIQLVGRTYRDVDVFRAGTAYEAADPWFAGPDRRPGI